MLTPSTDTEVAVSVGHRPGEGGGVGSAVAGGALTTEGARRAGPRRTRRVRRRLLAAAAVVAATALLVAGVLSDLHVRAELRSARLSLGVTRARLADTFHNLSVVESRLVVATNRSDSLQVTLDTTEAELATAEENLASTTSSLASTKTSLANASAGLFYQGVDIAALNACLDGVANALNQIAVGNQSGAVASLSAVAGSCQSAQGQGGGGPVYPFDFPDPDVIRVGSTYYGYATNSATGNIQVIQSTDLTQWSVIGDALPHIAPWAVAGYTWAPGVLALDDDFLLYYAVLDAGTGKQCISVAVASQPQGPFVDDSASPLLCQLALGGSIDPNPYLGADGTPYLTWKSEGAPGEPPTIWTQQLGSAGTSVVGSTPSALLRPDQAWEAGIVEAPAMLLWSGRYYLFYAGNNWDSGDYAIGVAVCQGPTGPCSKPLGHAIMSSQGPLSGPGGPSLFTDTHGGLWIAFHAWLPSAVGYPNSRLLFLRQVTFTDGIPVVQPAS